MMRATRSVEPPAGKPRIRRTGRRAPRRPGARRQPRRDAEIRGGEASWRSSSQSDGACYVRVTAGGSGRDQTGTADARLKRTTSVCPSEALGPAANEVAAYHDAKRWKP